jgi:hypothetical protein
MSQTINFVFTEQEFAFIYNAAQNVNIVAKDASLVASLQERLLQAAKDADEASKTTQAVQ